MRPTEYSKAKFKENILFPFTTTEECLYGKRVPYSYLHGKLIDQIGYNCYNANPAFIVECLKAQVFLATAVYKKKKHRCLVINFYSSSHGSMINYVLILTDLEGIKEAIKKIDVCDFFCGGYTSFSFIAINFPEIYNLFKSKI